MAKAEASGEELSELATRVADLERLLVLANDATFALAGIAAATLVAAGVASREGLASLIDHRAASPSDPDHNPLLRVFARAVRMNLPGGRFDVIDGGCGETAAR